MTALLDTSFLLAAAFERDQNFATASKAMHDFGIVRPKHIPAFEILPESKTDAQ